MITPNFKRHIKQLLFAAAFLFIAFQVQGQNAPVAKLATISNAVPGQQVTLPVTVTGFNNIGAFYLSLDYEYAKLHFVSGTYNPLLSGTCNIGEIDLGNGFHRLTISWYGNGVSLSDGSWIANYVFTFLSGPASLQWFDSGPSCQYTDTSIPAKILNDLPTSTYYANGSVSEPTTSVNAKVFLEGPYSAGTMSTSLRTLGKIPLLQPYSGTPWNYSGTEQVAGIPADVTDWVLVELRTGTAALTKVATRAGFLKNNGLITDLDGAGLLSFPGVNPGNYYIVIRHRNHMPVMSAAAVALNTSSALYDFSLGSAQVYGGTNGFKIIDSGLSRWGMISGDATNEGSIYINDYTDKWVPSFGLSEKYTQADFNMDGNVFINDYTDYWVRNFGKSNVLP